MRCIVEKDGTISFVEVTNADQKSYFVEEAKRIVAALPKLNAARTGDGTAVRSERIFPIIFDYREYSEK